MTNFYDQYLVNVSIIREENAGVRAFRYGPSGKDTQIATGVTMYNLPVIMRDSIDVPMPIREREEYHGIGSGKYPSKIVNKSAEPVSFTIEGPLQIGTFLGYAIGETYTSTATQVQITRVDCLADVTSSLNNKYFVVYDGTTAYGPWFNVGAAGSDPTGAGITGIEITIAANATAATVAAAINTDVGGHANFTCTYTATEEHIEIKSVTTGTMSDAYDTDTNFRVFTLEQGADATSANYAHRIQELITNELESFSMHVEMRNTTGAQNRFYDLFGCVVNSLELEMNKATGTITCRADIMAASWIAGIAATTKIGELTVEAFTWADLVTTGTTGYRLLDENHAEKAPEAIERLLLRINNNVTMRGTVGDPYVLFPVAGKREVSIDITGFIQTKTLYDYWKGTFNNVNNYMNAASSKMSAHLILQKTAKTDLINIFIYNIYLPTDGHNLQIQSIDDSIKAVELKLRCAQPDIDKRQLYVTIVDNKAKGYYHNEDES